MPLRKKKVWEVSEKDFPETGTIEAQLRFLLRYAILAPSVKNSQPWVFSVQDNRIHLIADLDRGQPVADPTRRELFISMGCALENLLVAAEHFGFRAWGQLLPRAGAGGAGGHGVVRTRRSAVPCARRCHSVGDRPAA